MEKALNECAARLRSAKTSAAGIRPTESGESVSEAGLPDERITEAVESAHLTEAVSKATSSNELDERRIEAVESADKSPRIQEEIQVTNGESQTMGGTQLRSAGRQAPEDERSTAEDKVQELLPVLLKQLKGISDQSKGAGAVGKND